MKGDIFGSKEVYFIGISTKTPKTVKINFNFSTLRKCFIMKQKKQSFIW